MSQGQSLNGDEGPVQTATGIASASISLSMCQGLAATIASPAAVAPASLANEGAGLAVLGVAKLAQKFL